MKHDKKIFWLIAGSILPLILMFFIPIFGIEDNNAIMLFLTALFIGHYYTLSKYIEKKRSLKKSIEVDKPVKSPPSLLLSKLNPIKFSIKRVGLAFGITGAIIYLGCTMLMVVVGREGTIHFFNSIFHGLETSSIIRIQVPWWEALIGIAETYILSWLVGACIAAIYNICGSIKTK